MIGISAGFGGLPLCGSVFALEAIGFTALAVRQVAGAFGLLSMTLAASPLGPLSQRAGLGMTLRRSDPLNLVWKGDMILASQIQHGMAIRHVRQPSDVCSSSDT